MDQFVVIIALVARAAVAPASPYAVDVPPPGVLAAMLVLPMRRHRRATPRLALGLAGVIGGGVAIVAGVPPVAVWLAGGLAWGAFAAAIVPIVLPPLPGLHRAEHGGLLPALA